MPRETNASFEPQNRPPRASCGKCVALGLGSNCGDRIVNLRRATCALLEEKIQIQAKSDVFDTPAWGYTEQPNFLNACLLVRTRRSPASLLELLKRLERRLGRVDRGRWQMREIDIDILFYADFLIETEKLSIPHPEMGKRAFVLVPLAQIAPLWIHPALGLSVEEMAHKLLVTHPEDMDRISRVAPL